MARRGTQRRESESRSRASSASQRRAEKKVSSAVSASSELRSTLALGQIIASNRPSAGSKLIANELRAIQTNLTDLKREISELPDAFATAMKNVLDDQDRNRLPFFSARRPMFQPFGLQRRMPALRRGAYRPPTASAQKSSSDSPMPSAPSTSTTNPIILPGKAATSMKSSSIENPAPSSTAASKSTSVANKSTKSTQLWPTFMQKSVGVSTYDDDDDDFVNTDSTDTSGSSS